MLYTCAIDLAGCPAPRHIRVWDWLARDSAHLEHPHGYRKFLVSIYLKLRRQTKKNKPICLTTLLLSSSDMPPPLMASLCLPHAVQGHARKQQLSIPEISLSAAGSSSLSASRDDAGNSSSVRLVTLWVKAHSNQLGTDTGPDAEQFCTSYSSLTITGLSSFKFKILFTIADQSCATILVFNLSSFSSLQHYKIVK